MTALAPLPSREVEVRLPNLHVGQLRRRREIGHHKARFVVTMCGRRWGKSVDGAEWVADGAIDGLSCGWFAPTYKYLIEVWDDLVHRLGPMAIRTDKTEKRIELHGGGLIECWTLDTPDPGRSRKYHRVVIDEAGIARGLLTIWQQSIRPTLTDYVGHAWIYGTPKGRTHDFTQLFAKGEGGDDGWLSFRAPTRENPYIPASEIEAARRDMPEAAFLQEFEGIPSDDGANPFGLTAIARCVGALSDAPPVVWGWDFARAQDWTVGIALDASGAVCRVERWQLVPWGETTERVVRATGENTATYGDSTGLGDVVVESIQRRGVRMQGVHFSKQEKQQLMERLSSVIQRGVIRFPDGPIRQELDAFQYEYSAGGVRYSAPSGLHDDCVMALALAVKGHPGLVEPRPVKVREMGADKPADRALPLAVKDGKLVQPVPQPKSLDEWVERLHERKRGRVHHRERMRPR